MPSDKSQDNALNFENPQKLVGERVISFEDGLGEILSIEKIQEGGGDYFVVKYCENSAKNYFPIGTNKGLRLISTKAEFEKVLKILEKERVLTEVESKKEKKIYFDRPLDKNNISLIANRICELASIKDLMAREQKIYDKLVNTLVLEASIVLDLQLKESEELITTYLRENNGKGKQGK